MIETIRHEEHSYPFFQSEGFASQYAFPFAKKVCKGVGFDVCCGKKEWALPGSIPIDLNIQDEWTATNLPFDVNYIFSSHGLEHLPDWVSILDYWTSKIKKEGTLFLYLPSFEQTYWRPWNNRKHLHIFTPEILHHYLWHSGKYKNIFVSGIDLYSSFMVMAEKI